MVKGVNKSVIEISQTGNKYFNKIILYVSPEYSQISNKKLNRQAEKLVDEITGSNNRLPLRKVIKKQKRKRLALFCVGAAVVITLAVLMLVIL